MESESTSTIYNLCNEIKKKYSEESTHTAYHLLLKLLNNIVNNPNEAKFRIFKKTNEAIKTKILVIKEIHEMLISMGYTDTDADNMTYKDPKVDKLKKAIDIISIYTKEIEEEFNRRELLKKNQDLVKLNEEINAKFREEQRKKKEILKDLENDKKERKTAPKATDSIGNDLKYGATEKKFECKDPKGG